MSQQKPTPVLLLLFAAVLTASSPSLLVLSDSEPHRSDDHQTSSVPVIHYPQVSDATFSDKHRKMFWPPGTSSKCVVSMRHVFRKCLFPSDHHHFEPFYPFPNACCKALYMARKRCMKHELNGFKRPSFPFLSSSFCGRVFTPRSPGEAFPPPPPPPQGYRAGAQTSPPPPPPQGYGAGSQTPPPPPPPLYSSPSPPTYGSQYTPPPPPPPPISGSGSYPPALTPATPGSRGIAPALPPFASGFGGIPPALPPFATGSGVIPPVASPRSFGGIPPTLSPSTSGFEGVPPVVSPVALGSKSSSPPASSPSTGGIPARSSPCTCTCTPSYGDVPPAKGFEHAPPPPSYPYGTPIIYYPPIRRGGGVASKLN